jgi:hypothetical protein
MTFCRDRRSHCFDLRVIAGGAIAVLLMTSAASSATIANRGDKEVKLTITEDASVKNAVLPVGKVIGGVCQKSCIIRLNDNVNDEYELKGSESVSVEGGFLYYDSSANEGAPPVGSTSSGRDGR